MLGLVALFWVFSPARGFCRTVASSEFAALSLAALAFASIAAIIMAISVSPGPRELVRASPILWILVGLSALSCLWSASFVTTLLAAATLGATVLLGYYLHRRLSLLQVLRLIFWSMGGLLALSLLLILLVPELGIQQGGKRAGAWAGVMGHRNNLGLVVAVEFFAATMLALWGTGRERLLGLLMVPITVLMLWPARSATAVVLVLAVSAIVGLGWLTQKRPVLRLPAVLLLPVMTAIVVIWNGPLLSLIGRDSTFSKRTVLWEHMAEVVMRRPLFGYGYRVKWTDVPALQADLVEYGRPWQAHIDSGYIAVAFWLGLFGAMLLALFLLPVLAAAVKRFSQGGSPLERIFPLALLVLLLLASFPQERMLVPDELWTSLLAFLAFHLGGAMRIPVGRGVALFFLLCFAFGCKPANPDGFLGFEEVSGSWGIGDLDARGVCVFDLDGDGDQDMLWVRARGSTLFENEGPGRFVDVSAERGILGFGNSMGCAALDLDRDGDSDLLITDNDGPTLLLRNDGSGHFSDATAESGLAGQSGQASIAAMDADGDGVLDLLLSGVQDKASALLFGDGAGGFDLPASVPVLDGVQRSWAAAWFDMDNDLLPDLFVGTDQPMRPGFRDSSDLLLRNLGGREFTDVTEEAAIGNSRNAMGLAVADVDQDGLLDLYVTNIGHQPLFLNAGNGSFVDTALQADLANHRHAPGWGSFWFDPDDDGREDLFVVLGAYYGETLKSEEPLHLPRSRNRLFRRLSEELEFEDQADALGLDDDAVGRGAAWADLDGDRLLDVVVANIEGGPSRVYRNLGVVGGSSAWRFRLRGVLSSPEALGARAELTACGQTRRRVVGTGPSVLSQGELTLHFGAAGCREGAELVVHWPSGLTEEWTLPGPGETWDIVEGEKL